MSDEPFDFVRYFSRVQQTPSWFGMMLGMARFAGIQAGDRQRVLDVGCGPGRLVSFLAHAGSAPTGIDNDPRMAAKAKSLYPTMPFAVGSVTQLPFPDHYFDVAISANLLFFLPDPRFALGEMARVVRPNGCVALWNPSENISVTAMQAYVRRHQSELDNFEQKHLPNWAQIGENNCRWNEEELAVLFADAGMGAFASELTLEGLARFARGKKR